MRLRILGVVGLLLFSLGSALASVTTYSDLSSWNAAVPGSTYVDLVGTLGGGSFNWAPTGITASGVTFTDPDNQYLYTASFYNNLGTTAELFGCGVGANCGSLGTSGGLHIALPTGIDAISFLYTAYYYGDFTITLSSGGSFTNYTDQHSVYFFGVTSTTDISYIDINVTNQLYGYPIPELGDIRYGNSAPAVPEPASITLLASGAAMILRKLRRA